MIEIFINCWWAYTLTQPFLGLGLALIFAILLVALFTLVGSACVSPTAAPQEPTATSAQATKAPIVLTVMTHDSFSISEEVTV